MNLTADTLLWEIGALIGVGLNVYMMWTAGGLIAVAKTNEERLVAWGRITQWAFGLAVKVVGLLLGLWAMSLPATGHPPTSELQLWAIEHRHIIFIGSLLLMMYGMDIRDAIIVFLEKRLEWWIRREDAK